MPLPKPYSVASEYVVNLDLRRLFQEDELNLGKLNGLIKEATRWSLEIDKNTVGFVANSWLNSQMEKISQHPEEMALYEKIEKAVTLLISFSVELDLWKAQNACFSIEKRLYSPMKERMERGDEFAKGWIDVFHRLGSCLRVKVP